MSINNTPDLVSRNWVIDLDVIKSWFSKEIHWSVVQMCTDMEMSCVYLHPGNSNQVEELKGLNANKIAKSYLSRPISDPLKLHHPLSAIFIATITEKLEYIFLPAKREELKKATTLLEWVLAKIQDLDIVWPFHMYPTFLGKK